MEHANKSLVAVQGADSLRVDVSDVLKYPESFLALCMSSQFVEKNTSGAIIVRDRDVKCFPLVEKYYMSGKVKILDAAMDLDDVREELSFWFPGSSIHIVYKDPLVHFKFIQGQKIDDFFQTEGERLQKEILARATEGHIDFTRMLDSALMLQRKTALSQNLKLFSKLVAHLFPDGECVVSLTEVILKTHMGIPTGDSDFPLSISWKLGVGSLGRLSEDSLKAKSKVVLRNLLAQAAEEFRKGSCCINLRKVFTFNIPDHFKTYFEKYVLSKSTTRFVLIWEKCYVCWNFTDCLV